MATGVALRALWLGAGRLGVAVVTYFTRLPDPPAIDTDQGDKLRHLVAYASLMLWFAQARIAGAERGSRHCCSSPWGSHWNSRRA